MAKLNWKTGVVLGSIALLGEAWYLDERRRNIKKGEKQLPPLRPEEPSGAKPALVKLQVKEALGDTQLTSDNTDVLFSDDGRVAFVPAPKLPVDVLVSVPAGPPGVGLSDIVQVRDGTELVAGTPGVTRDLVFRVRQHYPPDPDVDLENDAPISVGINTSTLDWIPVYVYVVG